MNEVVVARERGSGVVDVGVFLVDFACLGVKDAFERDVSASELDDLLGEIFGGDPFEEVDPACARKLIDGSVGYAQSLGFLPHRNFRKARKVLGGIDVKACAREFVFGRDGKPFFVAGPGDDEARIDRVMSVLTARLGEDGFECLLPPVERFHEDDDSGADFAIEKLYDFVDAGDAPDKSLTVETCHGFLVGILLIPETLMPSQWLPEFWGGEDLAPVFPDAETARVVLGGIMALYNQISDELRGEIFSPTLAEPGEPEHVADAGNFARGMLRGLGMRPTVLEWLGEHAEAREAIAFLKRLAGAVAPSADEHPEDWEDLDLDERLADDVELLFGLTRGLRPPPDVVDS